MSLGLGRLGAGFGGTGAASGLINSAFRNPTSADDSTRGNVVNELWLNASTGAIWKASSVSPGAAVWSIVYSGTALPGDAVASVTVAYGTKSLRTAWSNGNLFDVQRGSDNTTQTIVAISGKPDIATLNTFLSGTFGQVTRWYDQSGNGNHATQGTIANAPFVRVVNGQVQLVFDAKEAILNNPGVIKWLSLPSVAWGTSVSLFYVAQNLRVSASDCVFEVGTASANCQGIYNNGSNTYSDQGSTISNTFAGGQNSLNVWSLKSTSSASSVVLNMNEVSVTNNSSTAGSPVGGTIGKSVAFGGNFTADDNVYAVLGWSSALSTANMLLVREALYQLYIIPPQMANDNIVIDGASYDAGEGSFYPIPGAGGKCYGPSIQLNPLLNRTVAIGNYSVPGQTQVTMTTNYASKTAHLFNSSARNNILLLDTGGNDYPTSTSTVISSIQSYVTAAVATGFRVYLITLIAALPNPAYDAWRQTINTAMKDGTITGHSGVIDVASDPNLGPESNIGGTLPTLYFNNDSSPHPTALGYTVWDGYLAAKINSVLGYL